MSTANVRVRYRSGALCLYGPMTHTNAARQARTIRKLAEDPRSSFAGATVVAHHGGMQELRYLIGRDAGQVYGEAWRERLKELSA